MRSRGKKRPEAEPPSPVREALYFAAGKSSLGSVLVASSDTGVVAILIGATADPLARDLQQRFPDAMIVAGDKEAKRRVQCVIDYIESPARGLDLPLDMRGTEFQKRVWSAVREIPVGETCSYKDVAEKIGAPKAARAVGNACAMNCLALVVPCHRVLASDGSISEGWGRERKRILIEREARAD